MSLTPPNNAAIEHGRIVRRVERMRIRRMIQRERQTLAKKCSPGPDPTVRWSEVVRTLNLIHEEVSQRKKTRCRRDK